MTKKAAAKPKKTPGVKGFIKHNKKYIIIGLIVMVVLIFGIYRLQIYREQRQFAQAEVVLADLSTKIQKELGPPISSSTDKSCGYASVVYGRGRRRCGVNLNLEYPISTAPITSIGNKIDPIFLNNTNFKVTYDTLSKDPEYKEIGNDFHINNGGLKCSSTVREIENFEKGYPKISISIGCSRDAITEHFPVRD